jgi:hypothetical protein
MAHPFLRDTFLPVVTLQIDMAESIRPTGEKPRSVHLDAMGSSPMIT